MKEDKKIELIRKIVEQEIWNYKTFFQYKTSINPIKKIKSILEEEDDNDTNKSEQRDTFS